MDVAINKGFSGGTTNTLTAAARLHCDCRKPSRDSRKFVSKIIDHFC